MSFLSWGTRYSWELRAGLNTELAGSQGERENSSLVDERKLAWLRDRKPMLREGKLFSQCEGCRIRSSFPPVRHLGLLWAPVNGTLPREWMRTGPE